MADERSGDPRLPSSGDGIHGNGPWAFIGLFLQVIKSFDFSMDLV